MRRLIESARVAIELIYAGFDVLPENPSQCEHLQRYSGAELAEKWQSILDNFQGHKITADKIAKFLHPPTAAEELNTTVKLPVKLYKMLLEFALNRDTSIITIIEEMCYERFQVENSNKPASEEKFNAWQEDLRDLTSNI